MIVRQRPDTLLLITQPDHAQLAGLIMSRAAALRGHPRRASILQAVAEHDNGWREEDAEPTVHPGSGEVVDFVGAPLALRHRVWPRAAARLQEDPWAAALVAQHAITVYDRFRNDQAWHVFFAEMEVVRDRMLTAADRPLETLLGDYVHVRLGDLISLAFCTGWTDDHRFAQWIVRLDGDVVRITPDPFDGEVLPIRIGARELPRRSYGSDQELRRALADAPVVTLAGTVGHNQTKPARVE